MSTRARTCRSRWWRDDEGAVGLIELVLYTPLIVLMTFVPIQTAAFLHARNLAQAAAQDAAHAAAAADLSSASAQALGAQAAHRLVDSEQSLTAVSIAVTRGPTTVTADVRGESLQIIPGVTWRVHATAEVGVERFVGRGQS